MKYRDSQNCSENKVHWPFESDVLQATVHFVLLIQNTQMICIAFSFSFFESETLPILTTKKESEMQQFRSQTVEYFFRVFRSQKKQQQQPFIIIFL